MIKKTRILRGLIAGLCAAEVVKFYMGTTMMIKPWVVIALLAVAVMSEVGLIIAENKPPMKG